MLLFSARSGQLAARIGPRLQMSVGPVVVAAGLALLARATTPGSYWVQVFPAVLLFGFGLAITVAPLTATAMGAAPAEHAGVASAVNNTVARAGGLVCVAVLPLVAGLTGRAALGPAELASGFRIASLHLGRHLRGRWAARRAHDPQPRRAAIRTSRHRATCPQPRPERPATAALAACPSPPSTR